MKFLLDVHIGTTIARMLSTEGHDVVRAALEYATWSDRELLDLAAREALIIVTQDSDFSDLIYAFGAPPPPAILYMRCTPEHQANMRERMLDILDSKRLLGHMVVLRSSSTRYRPLPNMSEPNDRT